MTNDEALKRAILSYDLEEAERLLRAGADPDVLIGANRERSPYLNPSFASTRFRGLHLAANDDDPELAALLLLHGADPYLSIYAGTLPITIAAGANHRAVAEVLLHELTRSAGAGCPLRQAAYNGHLEMVELILREKANVVDLDVALHSAVSRKGNLAVTERLLAAGARADGCHADRNPAESATTRMTAVRWQPEALPLLVGHDQVRLIDAAIDGDLESVKRFLRAGASPDDADAHGYTTALDGASRCGRTDVVAYLLGRGATFEGPKGKADPLYGALSQGQLGAADVLWDAGCRTERMVERVALFGPLEAVRWALDRGGDPNTALWSAIRADRVDVARLALARGADANHRPRHESVLELAVARRPVEMVAILLEHGADLQRIDRNGWTVMHHALYRFDPDDPSEQPFDYPDDAIERPIVKLLAERGLAIPPRPG